MGVIFRESSLTTLVRLVGAAVGVVSLLFIYPLDHEAYGLATFLMNCAFLLVPLAGFGLPHVAVKFFKEYKDRSEDVRRFLPTLFCVAFVLLGVFCFSSYLVEPYFLKLLDMIGFDMAIVRSNISSILLLLSLVLLVQITTSYFTNFSKVVVPTILQDLGFKLFLPLIVLMVFINYIDKAHMASYLIGFYVLLFLLLLLYGVRQQTIVTSVDFGFFKDLDTRKRVLSFGWFSMLTSLGAVMAFKIDSVMITTLVDVKHNGLYMNVLAMAAVLDIPNQVIGKVSGPIISKSWTDKNTKEIKRIYRKSAISNFVVASIFFSLIWVNYDQLILLSSNKKALQDTSMLFLIIAGAKLFDGMCGVNSQIIAYSKYYRFNLYFLLVLACLTVVLNYLLIPKYGVVGAAIATFISIALFNVLKLILINFKEGMSPFSPLLLKAIIWTFFVLVVHNVVKSIMPDQQLLAILCNSALVIVLFFFGAWQFRFLPEANTFFEKLLNNLTNR